MQVRGNIDLENGAKRIELREVWELEQGGSNWQLLATWRERKEDGKSCLRQGAGWKRGEWFKRACQRSSDERDLSKIVTEGPHVPPEPFFFSLWIDNGGCTQ